MAKELNMYYEVVWEDVINVGEDNEEGRLISVTFCDDLPSALGLLHALMEPHRSITIRATCE